MVFFAMVQQVRVYLVLSSELSEAVQHVFVVDEGCRCRGSGVREGA